MSDAAPRSPGARSTSPHLARTSRKRPAEASGWPSTSLSTPPLASSQVTTSQARGTLDAPSSRLDEVRADDLLFAPVTGLDDGGALDDRGGKRRRLLPVPGADTGARLAGKVLSTALDAAIVRERFTLSCALTAQFTTAVGVAAYRIWRQAGSAPPSPSSAAPATSVADLEEPEDAPPPYENTSLPVRDALVRSVLTPQASAGPSAPRTPARKPRHIHVHRRPRPRLAFAAPAPIAQPAPAPPTAPDDLDSTYQLEAHQLEDDPEMAAFAERIRALVLQGREALAAPSAPMPPQTASPAPLSAHSPVRPASTEKSGRR